jgi:hypothetical protein
MLSLIACYSYFVGVPLYVLSLAFSSEDGVLARRFPRLRPRLWHIAVIIAVLAVDFAVLVRLVHGPWSGFRLYAFDAAVVLVPLVYATWRGHTVWDLWILANIVGLLGMLSLPAVAVR